MKILVIVYKILDAIENGKPLSVERLGLNVTEQTFSGVLRDLLNLGYISESENDNPIRLTVSGAEYLCESKAMNRLSALFNTD